MSKRKLDEIPYSHSHFTRKRKTHLQQRFITTGKDALPIVASTLDNQSISSFAATNRLFRDSANTYFRQQIFQHIANTSEVTLSNEAVRIINGLKHPRQILAILETVKRKAFPFIYTLESDLFTEYNNPICWYFLDDNLRMFLQCFTTVDAGKIFLPLALSYSRLEIAMHLLKFTEDVFSYRQMISLLQCVVRSGNLKLLLSSKFKNLLYSSIDPAASLELAVNAIDSGNPTMVTTVLDALDKKQLSEIHWSEIPRHALKRGNIEVFKLIVDYIRNQLDITSYVVDVNDAIQSGNLKMIEFIYGQNEGPYKKDETYASLKMFVQENSAAQGLEVYKFIERKHNIPFAITSWLVTALKHSRLEVFEYMRSSHVCSGLTPAIFESFFDATIKSGNVLVINYILKLARGKGVNIEIKQDHLILAAQTNAETYSKIVSLGMETNVQLIPTNNILVLGFMTKSSKLVKQILEHAKSCKIVLELTAAIMNFAFEGGAVRILQIFGTEKITLNRDLLSQYRTQNIANPFIHDIYNECAASSRMQLT